jgi:hypothetical protein
MNGTTCTQNDAWALLLHARDLCKPLIWLHDTDSPVRLTPKFQGPLQDALNTVYAIPGAIPALGEKLKEIYRRAIAKTWVGISGEGQSKRLGRRTAKGGLLTVLREARDNEEEFATRVAQSCRAGATWGELYALTSEFIEKLDWREFVLENPRGQAANLVLECTELLQAVMGYDPDRQKTQDDHVKEELGDVFYNLMAFSLSVQIKAEDLILTAASAAGGSTGAGPNIE